MRKTKYTVKPTTQFKKDYKLASKRGLNIHLLEDTIAVLAMGESLPEPEHIAFYLENNQWPLPITNNGH